MEPIPEWNQQGSGNGNGNSSNRNGGGNGNGKNGGHKKTASNFATETVSVKGTRSHCHFDGDKRGDLRREEGRGEESDGADGGAAEEVLFLRHLKPPGL